ncbi:DUF2694 domain-containing protein [Mycobacterium attenuatum]|uniref:DUF2694 domain-containing protein n=1 Tax=Mycobacterium attenuatum TaxID=2341086 RepID=UPI000F01C645|nr:DUF2694 domain-containing protein [Mycobacterium attenuatum]VBA61766.1 ESX-1 secretion-associated protein EspH [Mycobacterium attenuatum]
MMDWPSTDDYLDDLVTLDIYGRPRRQEPTSCRTDALVDWPPTDGCVDGLSTLDLYGRPRNRVLTGGDHTVPVEAEAAGAEPGGFPGLAETTDEHGSGVVTVANPQGCVSVSADLGGRIQRVNLSAGATSMGEQELADEILVIANLARQRARSAQYTLLLDTLAETPLQDPESRSALVEFVTKAMSVATPDEAAAAEAKVLSVRYARC